MIYDIDSDGIDGWIKKKLDSIFTFMFLNVNETCYGKEFVNITTEDAYSIYPIVESVNNKNCNFRRGRISDNLCSCENQDLETGMFLLFSMILNNSK